MPKKTIESSITIEIKRKEIVNETTRVLAKINGKMVKVTKRTLLSFEYEVSVNGGEPLIYTAENLTDGDVAQMKSKGIFEHAVKQLYSQFKEI